MGLAPLEAIPPLARLGDLSTDRFLERYWQREPCVLRQVFPGFRPELDEADIAGLACEELAESRLVSGRFPQHDWRVRHGPFEEAELAGLPDRDWTLLVQDVEKHYPPLLGLMRQFGFLPSWRLDDLMVSVAAPGGSVGPHVDASGRRRWDIAHSFDDRALPDCDLRVLERFAPETSWELGPGDILYLPPGIAHHGVALELGMTWSIGLRAPSAADLALAWGEWLSEAGRDTRRYTDPEGLQAGRAGEVDRPALDDLASLLGPTTDYATFLGAFLSTFRLAHAPAPPDDAPDLTARLSEGAVLRRNPWTRFTWIAEGEGAQLFAAGERIPCPAACCEMLCSADSWTVSTPLDPHWFDVLAKLAAGGHVYFE